MTKTTSLALALVSAVSFGLACSSSSSSPTSSVSTAAHEDSGGGSSGSGTSGCVQGSAKDMDLSCALFDGLPSAQVTALNDNCTKVMGTVVTTCPTTDLTGCCTTTVEGATQVTCVYSVSAASGESACKEQSGTWSTTP